VVITTVIVIIAVSYMVIIIVVVVDAPSGGGGGDGRNMCHAFQKGQCDRGDACRFSHGDASGSASGLFPLR